MVVVFGRPGERGRAGACGHVGAGVSRRRCGCDHVLAGESCLSREESVSRERIRVNKMAPSSREAIGPEVPDECPFSPPSPRGTTVQKFQMHAYSLVSPGVGWCATNEVVQFCLLWHICSVGWSAFFQRGVVFSQTMSLSTPCETFHFLSYRFEGQNLNPRVLARV